MKLLLSILAATSLMAATSTNIISCGNPTNQDSTPPEDDLNQKFLEKILKANPRELFSGELSITGVGDGWTTTINFDNNGVLPWEKILNFVVDYYQDPDLNIFQKIIDKKRFTVQNNLNGKEWIFDAKNVQVIDPDLIKFANNLKVEVNEEGPWKGEIKSFSFENSKDVSYLIPLSKEKILKTKISEVFEGSSNISFFQNDAKIQSSEPLKNVIDFNFDEKLIISSQSEQKSQLKIQNQGNPVSMENMSGNSFLHYLDFISQTHEVLNTFNEGVKTHSSGEYKGEKITAQYFFKNLKIKKDTEQIFIFIDKVNYSWDGDLIIDYPY